MSEKDIRVALEKILHLYPDRAVEVVAGGNTTSNRVRMSKDITRVTFELALLLNHIPPKARVADIGGGISLVSPGLASLGFESILVDDFGDRWHGQLSDALEVHRRLGVGIISTDVLRSEKIFDDCSLDAVTSFDMLEHLHSSPKELFTRLMRALKPNGVFFIGVPNCVNLRKRITVPFGIGKWSQIQEWYEEPVFRGHVREPDVRDLLYFASDLGLKNVQIVGRNWLGYKSRFAWVRALTPLGDSLLQLRPSLCSNIYLIGRKP